MWEETNETLQEIHKFVSEKPQDPPREVKGATEEQSAKQIVACSKEKKETANEKEKENEKKNEKEKENEKKNENETEKKDLNANTDVVPAVPPIVNNSVTEDSEYVGTGAMRYL